MPKLSPAYYLTIAGRISRSEYWLYFQLPSFIPYILLMVVKTEPLAAVLMVILMVMAIVTIIGGIRRFHDRDKSGWWMLICLIPLIGGIWLFVELGFLKGTEGSNRFGADPVVIIP